MNKKQYLISRFTVIILLSMSISISISSENYYLPIVFIISAMAVMYYLKKQLVDRSLLPDERDYHVAGNAARYTIYIFAIIGTIATFVLMALSSQQGPLYDLSLYFSYTVCFLVFCNAIIFRILSRK